MLLLVVLVWPWQYMIHKSFGHRSCSHAAVKYNINGKTITLPCKHSTKLILPFSSVVLQMTHCILNKTLQLKFNSVCVCVCKYYWILCILTSLWQVYNGSPLNWIPLAAKILSLIAISHSLIHAYIHTHTHTHIYPYLLQEVKKLHLQYWFHWLLNWPLH